VREGALLCRIPKAAVLSPRTTGIAALLEEERIGHGLVGLGISYIVCKSILPCQ
jgi:hypothetical protein